MCGSRWGEGRGGCSYPQAAAALLRALDSQQQQQHVKQPQEGQGSTSAECLADSTGEGPLHAAVRNGNVEVVAALCGIGATAARRAGVAAAGPRGVTALHLAAAAGLAEAVEALAAAGAPLEARWADPAMGPAAMTDFHYLVSSPSLPAEEGLFSFYPAAASACLPLPREAEGGWTALHIAAQSGQAATVAALLRAGVSARLAVIASLPVPKRRLLVCNGVERTIRSRFSLHVVAHSL